MHTFLLLGAVFAMTIFSSSASALSLHSPTINNNDTIPVIHTCDDKDISPALSWTDIPEKTETLALILADPDAPSGTFFHWVLFNIPKKVTTFPEGVTQLPPGTKVGKNSFGKQQYNGPCPPKGLPHHYIFSLYALDSPLALPDGADAKKVLQALQGHVISEVRLMALYGR